MNLFLTLAATLLSLWLTGCATSVPGTPDSAGELYALSRTPSATPQDRSLPGLKPPLYPSASLHPLATLALSAPAVHALTPPADIWERIRSGFAMPDLQSELVTDREQWYSSRPDYVQRMTERGSKYLFHIVEELERRNMPSELALLPFIESAFNPQAVSSARAAGMWQFMPATGRHFDLTQNMFRDDRRDVLASTRAALDYLQRLHGMFGDWHLALAAYNWGEGSVGRAIAKNRKLGLGSRYVDLKMPMETQFYVPKLQAVKNIVGAPGQFGVSLPPVGNHPYFQSVDIRNDIDVSVAAKLAEVPLADFKALNPAASKPVLLAAGTPQILLPWDNAAIFQSNLEAYSGPLASWTAWVAPATLKPADAAERVGMSEGELREANQINGRMLIKAGSTLLVRRSGGIAQDVSTHVADNGHLSLTPEQVLRKTWVKARKKDSLRALASRYKLNVNEVAQWNQLSASAALKAGQKVALYLPAKAPGKRSAKASSQRKTARVSNQRKTAKAPASKKRVTASASKRKKPSPKAVRLTRN